MPFVVIRNIGVVRTFPATAETLNVFDQKAFYTFWMVSLGWLEWQFQSSGCGGCQVALGKAVPTFLPTRSAKLQSQIARVLLISFLDSLENISRCFL